MSKRTDEIIEFTKENKFTTEEFLRAIETLYAAHIDVLIDESPGREVTQKTKYKAGHTLIIKAHREYLN